MGYIDDTGDGGPPSGATRATRATGVMGRGVTRMRGEIWFKRKKRPEKERKEI